MLPDGYAAPQQIDDVLQTLLNAGLENSAGGIRVGAAEKIGCLFESIECSNADVSAVKQAGKVHSVKDVMLRLQCVYRNGLDSDQLMPVLRITGEESKIFRGALRYLLKGFPVIGGRPKNLA